jgi:type IV pilus assembly protein PilF
MRRQIVRPLVLSLIIAFAACARPLATGALTAGVAAARQDGWEEAARHWRAALERDPGSAAAHNNLAIAYEKLGAWEEARREYGEALGLAPEDRAIKENYEAFMARLASGRGKRP